MSRLRLHPMCSARRRHRSPDASAAPRSDALFPSTPAFTLIELIVVIIILGVMAGVTVPRLFGNTGRAADTECQTVQRLLTIAAERESLYPEPMALEYDSSAQTLSILIRRRGAAFSQGRSGAAAESDWARDAIVLPAAFSTTALAAAWADGRPLPKGDWRVVFTPTEPRPALVLQVESKSVKTQGGRDEGSRPAWQVILAPDAAAAARTPVRAGAGAVPMNLSRAIDLDQAGRGEKSW